MIELTAETVSEMARDTMNTWFPRYTEYDDKQQAQWHITQLDDGLYRFDAPDRTGLELKVDTRVFALVVAVHELQ